MFPIRILGTYDSYEIAKPKLRLAEEHSDLNSDYDEGSKERRRQRNKVVISSDEGEEEENCHLIKPFPPITSLNHAVVSPHPPNKPVPCSMSNLHPYTDSVRSFEGIPLDAATTSSISSHQSYDVEISEDFKQQILKDMSFLKTHIVRLHKRLDTIQVSLTNKNEETVTEVLEFNFDEELPLPTIANINTVEEKLKTNPEYKRKLISYLSQIGGNRVDEVVKLILRRLFTDKIAAEYSWLGAKKKRVFSGLSIADVILKSVRANTVAKTCTEKEIVDSIKNWLRHALTRSNNRDKKSQVNVNEKSDSVVHGENI